MSALAGEQVILRADGGAESGIGHLMRCLALADALAGMGAKPALWTQQCPQSVADIYAARGYSVFQAPPPQKSARWLVVDSYTISAPERTALRAYADHLMVIDDLGDNGPYDCALLLNPNPGARTDPYWDAARAIAGAEYVLLRAEILRADVRRRSGLPSKILVSCGGTDPTGAAVAILKSIEPIAAPEMTIKVLTGVAPDNSISTSVGAAKLEVLRGRFDMAAQLNWADVGILAAGTVQWEAAYLGCPFVAVVVADNQVNGAQSFAQRGGSICVDWRAKKDPQSLTAALTRLLQDKEVRTRQTQAARNIIDGDGAQRVVQAMAQIV
ncbi:MAG: UDP-2,4-diacetamido-2,4,6-trideoxy-beta-L-altropyranose hydrolase [Pseudomonadota bacterium]